jgi:hypothetical protein
MRCEAVHPNTVARVLQPAAISAGIDAPNGFNGFNGCDAKLVRCFPFFLFVPVGLNESNIPQSEEPARPSKVAQPRDSSRTASRAHTPSPPLAVKLRVMQSI